VAWCVSEILCSLAGTRFSAFRRRLAIQFSKTERDPRTGDFQVSRSGPDSFGVSRTADLVKGGGIYINLPLPSSGSADTSSAHHLAAAGTANIVAASPESRAGHGDLPPSPPCPGTTLWSDYSPREFRDLGGRSSVIHLAPAPETGAFSGPSSVRGGRLVALSRGCCQHPSREKDRPGFRGDSRIRTPRQPDRPA
jgi:hypothetical protein